MSLNTSASAEKQGHAGQAMALVALVWALSGAVICAQADDRPFLRTTNALAADDDDGWEVSSTLLANRKGQALSVQIEHDLSATQRLEVEFGKTTRADAPEPEQGLRLRSLWVSPADAGWGLATKLGMEPRSFAGPERWQALLALSAPSLHERLWLHANLGLQWRRGDMRRDDAWRDEAGQAPAGERRTLVGSLAGQYAWSPQRTLYLEAAGSRDGLDRLLHLGVRHWLVPHKLALDVGGGRQNGAERTGGFVAVNLSFFDLNF